MTKVWRAGALFCALCLLFCASPASAALKLCNQTSYVLYAATGFRSGDANVTQGWKRVVPGDCRELLHQPLASTSYFLYARSSQAHTGEARAWGGAFPLCVKDGNFLLKTPFGASTCTDGNAFTESFSAINTSGLPSWTTTLTETSAIASLDDARRAGINRLLGDLGYQFADDDGREKALARFRRRVNLVPNASDSDLFDAMETEAMKIVSPAGYSICNDTGGVIWTALAFKQGKDQLSAGWWKVQPGGCAHALTQPLNIDDVFVHAEGPGHPALVGGPDKFCVANITFQTMDTGNCAAHGLSTARFTRTHTKGASGYTAHISEGGLEPQASVQTGTPK
jgi:uncharacterized membrane protein